MEQHSKFVANFPKVSSILNYHATKATQASNDKAGKMAELAKSDNNLMLKMTKKSVTDARTLKTITILTLVYLPASFVSVSCPKGDAGWLQLTCKQTFLGMNYIEVEKTKPLTLSCKSEMVIFAILTIPLLLVTLGYWGVLEIRQRRRESREDADRQFAEKPWP